MTVTLIGAGPGEEGLMTLKGAERLRNADIVLYDRFVGSEILAMIPDSAEMIDVGKHAGNHPVPQDEINSLLLDKAKPGLNVVRLKGGDPFVFGRGGEELEFLAAHDIPFEVIPGISSSIAGPGYAGIPVTHRDYASSFHVITSHAKNDEKPRIDYEALARTKGTLIFMMGVSAISEISAGCIAAGMDKDMPAAIIENATTNLQRKFIGTIETLPRIAIFYTVESPAVIVIGEVCRLSERLDWFGRKPLLGRYIIVPRVRSGKSKLSENLRELGMCVIEIPCAAIAPLTFPGCPLEVALEKINNYSWLVFTSAAGVNVFFDYLHERKTDVRSLHHLKIACVGTETGKEICRRGVMVDFCPDEYNGEALAKGLTALIGQGERALIARAADGAEDLTRILEEGRVEFDDVAIYEKIRKAASEKIPEAADMAAFTSSSSVRWFAEAAADTEFEKIKGICIGESTAKAARSYGMTVHVSRQATMDSMVEKIKELCE